MGGTSLNFLRITSSEKGFGLVQVLVSASLIGILALISAEMLQNQMKGQTTIKTRQDVQLSTQALYGVLTHAQLCTCNLRGRGLNLSAPTNINKFSIYDSSCGAEQNLVTVGQPLAGSTVSVRTMQLYEPVLIAPNQYSVKFLVGFDVPQGQLSMKDLKYNNLILKMNGSAIDSCQMMGFDLSLIGQCPTGQYLHGFSSNGQKLCETPPIVYQ